MTEACKDQRKSRRCDTYSLVELDLWARRFGDIFSEILEQEKPEPLVEDLLEADVTGLLEVLLHDASDTEDQCKRILHLPGLPWVGQDDLLRCPGRRLTPALFHGHQVGDIGENRFEIRHLVQPAYRSSSKTNSACPTCLVQPSWKIAGYNVTLLVSALNTRPVWQVRHFDTIIRAAKS